MAEQVENLIDDIEKLLKELSTSREELKKYITDVDILRNKISEMFPQNMDFRNRYVLDDKIKTMSSFYGILLNIRQEINKTIKEEIELRRKLKPGGDNTITDIRQLAEMIENHNKK